MALTTPPSSGRGHNASSNTTSITSVSNRKWIQGLLILCLGLVLGHSLTLLRQGHALLEEQQDQFAAQHKNNFLHQQVSSKKNYGAQWIPNGQPPPTSNPHQPLESLKILVAIASYDFSQLPHLEETLDGYHDVCVAGVDQLHIVIHTTVVYPVAWLDLWRTRFHCPNFRLTLSVHNPNLRLHLVDLHRQLFYEELHNYDLFIYTEDDIRVTPTTVATYWQETQTLQKSHPVDYTLYNVGIVRYEYNFPSVVIDDKTRHATENVTRVYWEHSMPLAQHKPIVPNAAQGLDRLNNERSNIHYIHMRNHHQGLFLATRAHLVKWKQVCNFDVAVNRPGYGKNQRQPILGTQRVWMSSYQLYEPNYCHIQQVLPVERLGALTVHHVPNKNYRRKKGGKTLLEFGNQTSYVGLDQGSSTLVTALQLHLTLRREYPMEPKIPYRGCIRMEDHVTADRTTILEERFRAWTNYVKRGGILSDDDMARTNLIEWEQRLQWITKAENRKRRAEQRKRQQEEG